MRLGRSVSSTFSRSLVGCLCAVGLFSALGLPSPASAVLVNLTGNHAAIDSNYITDAYRAAYLEDIRQRFVYLWPDETEAMAEGLGFNVDIYQQVGTRDQIVQAGQVRPNPGGPVRGALLLEGGFGAHGRLMRATAANHDFVWTVGRALEGPHSRVHAL